jgi:glycosyltransferase involved in cell wall biosynthesis
LSRHSIIINAIPLLSKFTGIAKYTYEISKRILQLDHDFDSTFYYGYFSKKLYFPDFPNISSEEIFAKKLKNIFAKIYFFKKIAREGILFTSKFLNKKCDVYWEPNIVPIRHIKSRHLITTVHDFSFYVYPDWHPKETMEYFKKHFWENISKSESIITASQCTKNEICEFLHYDPSRVSVIHHGVDYSNFKLYDKDMMQTFFDLYKLPEKFILFVGSIEPRKNLKNALLAYNSLPDAFKKEHKFLLAGFSGWNNAEVMDIICREKGNIIYLGYLSDRELAYLYNLASVFIYPSLYEGFGLPPLEAMACGAPVIVSRVSSMPEICGEAAYYVDPLDVTDIAEGIYTMTTNNNLRKLFIDRGLQKVKMFDWDTSAKEHLAIFNEVMNR